jgi:hypothetical protein
MLLSGRETRLVLEAAGFSTWHARTALRSGLVGEPIRTTAGHLYDEARVRELAARPVLGWGAVIGGGTGDGACPQGIFVGRRDLDLSRPLPTLDDPTLTDWEGLNPWAWVSMSFRIKSHGSFPFVTTVAGVVVIGADIVGLKGGSRLTLADPGSWFERLRGVRLPTGPGRPWVLQLS